MRTVIHDLEQRRKQDCRCLGQTHIQRSYGEIQFHTKWNGLRWPLIKIGPMGNQSKGQSRVATADPSLFICSFHWLLCSSPHSAVPIERHIHSLGSLCSSHPSHCSWPQAVRDADLGARVCHLDDGPFSPWQRGDCTTLPQWHDLTHRGAPYSGHVS